MSCVNDLILRNVCSECAGKAPRQLQTGGARAEQPPVAYEQSRSIEDGSLENQVSRNAPTAKFWIFGAEGGVGR